MTRSRVYGDDTPFGNWLRRNPRLDSIRAGITVSDIDYQFHQYKLNIDRLGPRAVNLMQITEVKTCGARPNDSQRQTLFFHHQLLDKRRQLSNSYGGPKVAVWHFGCFVLSMPGMYPGEIGDTVTWYRFSESGELLPSVLTVEQLEDVLAFRLNPLTLCELSLRRHHKTVKIISTEKAPLGFAIERIITRRS